MSLIKKIIFIALLLILNLIYDNNSPLWARGGGGCLIEGTSINTPNGKIPVEDVKSGDYVLGWNGKNITPAKVLKVLKISDNEYIELATPHGIIRTTPEHPIFINGAELKNAQDILNSDSILMLINKDAVKIPVLSIRTVKESRYAYNLIVEPPATFLANDIVVHNKGCFLPDTEILLSDGRRIPISQIKVGDNLAAFTLEGDIVAAPVKEIITSQSDRYYEITTDRIIINVTAEHPLYIGNKIFRLAEAVNIGEHIFIFDGTRLAEDVVITKRLVNTSHTVYNLRTDYPNTFFANGVAVHNKGGGGGGRWGGGGRSYGGRSSSSGKSWEQMAVSEKIVVIGVVSLLIAVLIINRAAQGKSEDLDYCYPISKLQKKTERTNKLLTFLSKQDSSVSPEFLKKTASDAFLKLQECWQSRDYTQMKSLMMQDLYEQHLKQIDSMKRSHEINILKGLRIDFTEIINLRYYEKKSEREFTAIIQAKARDYYIDDRTKEFIRGDSDYAKFQELWTFQYDGKNWLLREIEQTKESDALSESNFVEMFTDKQMSQIYGEAAAKDIGPIGPELSKYIKTRDDRIHRHLNFLVRIDKLWDENEMKETARNVFINFYTAQESGNIKQIEPLLFPEIYDALQKNIIQRKEKGEAVEFRNLCVRKVDIVLIRNFTDNTKDEFTVRLTAHAQKVFKQNNEIIRQDEYVAPSEHYWTFSRKEDQWLLKEILPSVSQLAGKTDIDEDVTKEQIEWYHTKDRAL